MVASTTDQDGLLLKRQLNLPFLNVGITTPTWCVEPCYAFDSKYNARVRDFAALPNLCDTFVTTSICPNSPQIKLARAHLFSWLRFSHVERSFVFAPFFSVNLIGSKRFAIK